MKLTTILFLILPAISLAQTAADNPDLPYENFAQAYRDLDAEALASLYTDQAELLSLYQGRTPSILKGKKEIQDSFQAFFDRAREKRQQLIITFKITDRRTVAGQVLDNGFYRLTYVQSNLPDLVTYGKFSIILENENGTWKFKTDANTNAEAEEYENPEVRTIPEKK